MNICGIVRVMAVVCCSHSGIWQGKIPTYGCQIPFFFKNPGGLEGTNFPKLLILSISILELLSQLLFPVLCWPCILANLMSVDWEGAQSIDRDNTVIFQPRDAYTLRLKLACRGLKAIVVLMGPSHLFTQFSTGSSSHRRFFNIQKIWFTVLTT